MYKFMVIRSKPWQSYFVLIRRLAVYATEEKVGRRIARVREALGLVSLVFYDRGLVVVKTLETLEKP